MISYREKQLLMVQKMLQEEGEAILADAYRFINEPTYRERAKFEDDGWEEVENYEDLVFLAEEKGYNTYIRAKDILSSEELEEIDRRKEEIEKKFKKLVEMQDADVAFLFVAVLLQIVKQILLRFDFENQKETANQTDKEYKKKYSGNLKRENKFADKSDLDGATWKINSEYYYAPLVQIKNTPFVPYDIVKNTKNYEDGSATNLKLNGNNHRYKTVGHDPILGLLFGTGNILTNTATFYKGSGMETDIIRFRNEELYRDAYICRQGSTSIMLLKIVERWKKEKEAVKIALRKQIDHIASDEKSIAGIPIPFFTLILDSSTAEKISKMFHLDYAHFKENLKIVGKQAVISEVINILITFLHRVYLLWDEVKDEVDWKGKTEGLLKGDIDQFEQVRSRKIILYSDLIASSLNLAVCVGGGMAVSVLGNNEKKSRELFEHIDIGGYIATIRHLFEDNKFILKVKKDFIQECSKKEFNEKLNAILVGEEYME